jgi:hypothetical protein
MLNDGSIRYQYMHGQHIYIGHYKNEENDLFLQFLLGNLAVAVGFSTLQDKYSI